MSDSPISPDLLANLRQLRWREGGSEHDGGAIRLPISAEVDIRWGRPMDEIRAEMIADATDHDLLAAYQHSTGEQGDPEADALLVEIDRRGLNV